MFTTLLHEEHSSAILALDEQYTVDLPLGFYRYTEESLLTKCLSSGLSLGIFDNDKLVGYRLTFVPGLNEFNLGHYLGMTNEELTQVAQLYGTLIAPAFRGLGLGSKLVRESVKLISERGFRYALVTVHPANQISLTMLKHGGFVIMKEITFYGGLPRLLLKNQMNDRNR